MTRKRQMKTRWLLAITALAMLGAACGGDDESAAGDPDVETPAGEADSASEAEDDAPAASTGDECRLTTDEVSDVVGVTVADIGCAWTSDTGAEGTGPDDLRIDVFYSEFPAELFDTYREQAEEDSEVVSVEGIGDEAYSVADSGLSVLAGELAFSIHVAVHNRDTDFDADAAERELAELIIGRES